MGRTNRIYLAGEAVFTCRSCGNHLAVGESVMSNVGAGRRLTPELYRPTRRGVSLPPCVSCSPSSNPSVNTYTSAESEDRLMRTGKHTVRDLYCGVCRQVLGWKYVSGRGSTRGGLQQDIAFEPGEKYKEGKYILEREMIHERKESKHTFGRPMIEEVREVSMVTPRAR